MTTWTPGLKRSRNTVWLSVNGKVNTLRAQFIAHGYRVGFASNVSQRLKCKQSEVPIEAWREYFGEDCHFASQPSNANKLIAGNRVPVRKKSSPVARFLGMRLTSSPAEAGWYY